ncbi:MAG: lipase family protein [Planctomycetes bacterium]|nr:lipase family protein [Planctomycetota bacterium]
MKPSLRSNSAGAKTTREDMPHQWKSRPLAGPIGSLSLLKQSLLFAELADIAYYREDIVCKLVAQTNLPTVRYFECDGSQAFLLSNEHDAVIVCRGTEAHEWNDIKADLNALTAIAETVGRVHRGFKQEVDDLWPHLEQALESNAKELWFTGHSLGAAMATICAGRCQASSIKSVPAGVFSFGSPRVGNKRYVHSYKMNLYRWVNNNDVVTRMPPPWFGYRHTGQELYLNANGDVRRLTKWQRSKDRWRGFWRGLKAGKIDHFDDHMQGNYIRSLHEAVQDEEAGVDVFRRAAEKLWSRALHKIGGRDS